MWRTGFRCPCGDGLSRRPPGRKRGGGGEGDEGSASPRAQWDVSQAGAGAAAAGRKRGADLEAAE